MALTSGTIPNLLGGVTQQPLALRHPTQLELQKNMTSSLVEGLSKRPPLEYYDYLGADKISSGDAFIHFIDRDPTERYVLILKDGATPLVYDIVNKEFKTVAVPNGVGYLDVTGSPKSVFRAVTVADYTFIVNTETVISKVDACTTAATGTITLTGNPNDAETVIISDGVLEVVFEFQTDSDVANASNTLVTVGANGSATAANLKAAIEASGLLITVEEDVSDSRILHLTNDQMGTEGNCTMTETATALTVSGMSGGAGSRVRSTSGTQGAILNVEIAANSVRYTAFDELSSTVVCDETTADTGVIKTEDIAIALEADVDGVTGYAATRAENSLFIFKAGTTGGFRNMDLRAHASLQAHYIQLTQDQVQDFTNLPAKGRRGYVAEVTGDPGTLFDNYYVVSQSLGGHIGGASIGDILWEETVAPNIHYQLDASTMPHILVREADGTFTFKQAEWSDRGCGDETTNPWATFVDSTIVDVFFFKNRLGVLSGENVILSEIGQYFNFFRTTVTTKLDTDPIDVSVSINQVAKLHHAALIGKRLFALSDRVIFELEGDPLTPASAALNPVARYPSNRNITPVAGGDNIYFTFARGSDFCGVYEFVPRVNSEDEAFDTTSHIPRTLAGNVDSMAFSDLEQTLFVHTDGMNLAGDSLTNRVYVYKTHWEDRIDGREKVVSAWSYWEFPLVVLQIRVIDEYLYVVMFEDSTDRLYLCRIDLRDGTVEADGWDWRIHIDMKVPRTNSDVTGVFSGGNTTFTLPYRWDDEVYSLRVMNLDTTNNDTPTTIDGSTGEVVFEGSNKTAVNLVFGLDYSAVVQFSIPVPRTSSGDREVAIPDGDLTLLFWSITYANSGHVRAKAWVPAERVYEKFSTMAGLTGQLKSGIHKFPVRANTKQKGLKIEVINSGPYPTHLINAGWEGNFVLRSRQG